MASERITVNVNLQEPTARPVDQWDAPALSTPATFHPLPIPVKEGFLIALWLFMGWIVWNGNGHHVDQPLVVAWAMFIGWMAIRIPRWQGLTVFGWLGLMLSHLLLVMRAPKAWPDPAMRGSTPDRSRFTALLPPEMGRAAHANITFGRGPVFDVGRRLEGVPKDIQEMGSQALGKERFRAVYELTTMGDDSLLSPGSRRGWCDLKMNFWGQVYWPGALHLLTRAFPPHELEIASGPVWREAGQLARGLVAQRFFLAVHGGTVDVLRSRMIELEGTDPQRGGRLAQAGYGYRLMQGAELEELADDVWGGKRKPAIAVAPGMFEVWTGGNDPDPLLPGNGYERIRGVRSYVSVAVRGFPRKPFSVGYFRTLTMGRALGDYAMHFKPEDRFIGPNSLLKLKASWFEWMPFDKERFGKIAVQIYRHLTLVDERATTTLSVGIYASAPVTHIDDVKGAMGDLFGRENVYTPWLRQREARAATEPWGRDQLQARFLTDSQMMAMIGPPGGGVRLPKGKGIFFATSASARAPIMYSPWFEGDRTPIAVLYGASGSGKTNASQMILAAILEPHPEHELYGTDVPVVVLYFKPLDEWEAYCARFAGTHIHVDPDTAPGSSDHWESVVRDAPIGPGILAINLNDLDEDVQSDFVQRMVARCMWYQRNAGDNFRKRFALLIGEAWVLARTTRGARQLQGLALRVRALRIWLVLDTQYVDHLLNSAADDVRRSASMVVLMQFDEGERNLIRDKFGLSDEAFNFLSALEQPNTLDGMQTVRGAFLGRVHGLWVKGYVERLGELAELGDQTSPAKRRSDPSTFARLAPRSPGTNGKATSATAALNGRHTGPAAQPAGVGG